jgi:aspartate aminotransferase
MNLTFADRVNRIQPSATLAVTAKAIALKAQGKNILTLSVGEPDFDTPEHIKQAAIAALGRGFTKYTQTVGTIELRQAIVHKLAKENNLSYDPKQIIVSCGAKQSIFNTTQVLLQKGDEVLIPTPAWPSYKEIVLLAGALPVLIQTSSENRFKLTPEALEAAITPQTRLLMLNSPSNPTGVAYTKHELAQLGEVLLRHPKIMIMSDDIYEKILWGSEPFANILNACPDLYDRTIVINGVSKAYAMTGWRIGYAAATQPLVTAMEKVQSQCTSGANSIAQVAAQAAIEGSQQCVLDMVKEFKKRHDFAYQTLKTIPGIQCQPADGAFYLFIGIEEALKQLPTIHDDIEFSEYLLQEAGVAVIPGSSFDQPGYIRISTAVSQKILAEALEKIRLVLQ